MALELFGAPEEVACSAWNLSSSRFATASSPAGLVTVCDRFTGNHVQSSDVAGTAWDASATWQVIGGGAVTKLLWVPEEFGNKLAVVVNVGEGGGGEPKGVKSRVEIWGEDLKSAAGGREQLPPCQSWSLLTRIEANMGTETFSSLYGSKPTNILDSGFCMDDATNTLLLVTVLSTGRLLIFENHDELALSDWQLQANVPLVSTAETSFGKPLLLSASLSSPPSPLSSLPPHSSAPCFILGTRGISPSHNTLSIWTKDLAFGKWHPVVHLSSANEIPPAVNQVAWAPNMGRPYDLIAVAEESAFSIWEVHYMTKDRREAVEVRRKAQKPDHKTKVVEVAWDMGGTSLATLGDDGKIKTWKMGMRGDEWVEQREFIP